MMVPIKVLALSARQMLTRKLTDSYNRISRVEALEERKHNAKNRWLSYHKQTRIV